MFFDFFANNQDIKKKLHLTRSQVEFDFGHYWDVTPLFTADWLCQNSINDISTLTWARQFSSSASLVCHNLGEIFSKGQWKCESVCCKKVLNFFVFSELRLPLLEPSFSSHFCVCLLKPINRNFTKFQIANSQLALALIPIQSDLYKTIRHKK